MAEIKVSEKEINKLIYLHKLDEYVRRNWHVEIDPKEVIYQLELTEIGKCKKLHKMISCLVYDTVIKVAMNEAKRMRLRSKNPRLVKVKLWKSG